MLSYHQWSVMSTKFTPHFPFTVEAAWCDTHTQTHTVERIELPVHFITFSPPTFKYRDVCSPDRGCAIIFQYKFVDFCSRPFSFRVFAWPGKPIRANNVQSEKERNSARLHFLLDSKHATAHRRSPEASTLLLVLLCVSNFQFNAVHMPEGAGATRQGSWRSARCFTKSCPSYARSYNFFASPKLFPNRRDSEKQASPIVSLRRSILRLAFQQHHVPLRRAPTPSNSRQD